LRIIKQVGGRQTHHIRIVKLSHAGIWQGNVEEGVFSPVLEAGIYDNDWNGGESGRIQRLEWE